MRIIKAIKVERFRGLVNQEIKFDRPVNAIIGKNGAMKTTLLGMIAHPFSLKTSVMYDESPLSGGKSFNSQMNDKFKFSDEFDRAHEHKWTLVVDKKIYEKEEYTCESERRTDTGRIRFWSTEGREKGMNFIQCPVIYLSMKRLSPLGEEKQLKIQDTSLSNDELLSFKKAHNSILISTDAIEGVSELISKNKRTVGTKTSYSDAVTISAGQDNIGRILLAVLSMRRLKEKYPHDYKGGIICIDEIESTLYPASQEKLIDYMHEAAAKYSIQFFFTTHSMSIVNYLKLGPKNERNSITYLKKAGPSVNAISNPSLRSIENDLYVASGKESLSPKIKVYCEDLVGTNYCKALLPEDIKKKVSFVTGMDLGWTNYKTLVTHKVPEFLDNIIVLDGDVQSNKDRPRSENVTFLPGESFPEDVVYNMLYALDATDEFWNNDVGGYGKDVCFRDYVNYIDSKNGDESKKAIKSWFQSQKKYIDKKYMQRLFKEWIKKNPKKTADFVNNFVNAYNSVAKRTGFEPLEVSLKEKE